MVNTPYRVPPLFRGTQMNKQPHRVPQAASQNTSYIQSGIVLDQVPIQSLAQVPSGHLSKCPKGT